MLEPVYDDRRRKRHGLTFNRLRVFSSSGPNTEDSMQEDDTPEDRLEAALERIAQHLQLPDPIATDVAARLDGIIATLRQALASDGPDRSRSGIQSAGQRSDK